MDKAKEIVSANKIDESLKNEFINSSKIQIDQVYGTLDPKGPEESQGLFVAFEKVEALTNENKEHNKGIEDKKQQIRAKRAKRSLNNLIESDKTKKTQKDQLENLKNILEQAGECPNLKNKLMKCIIENREDPNNIIEKANVIIENYQSATKDKVNQEFGAEEQGISNTLGRYNTSGELTKILDKYENLLVKVSNKEIRDQMTLNLD